MANVKITDLIDAATLQEIQTGVAKLAGAAVAVEDDTNAADFLCTVAKALSAAADGSDSAVTSVNRSMMSKIAEAEIAVQGSTRRIRALANAFENVSKIAENTAGEVASTTGTVKVIQDIAMNTKILGFNASIEASRAKESGKGFGVIAQEVRNLAETSKSSADKIEKTMQHIGEYSKEMNEQVVNTKDAVNKCLEDLNSFSALLSELKTSSAE